MTEPPSNLEARLAALQPRAVSADLEPRIAAQLTRQLVTERGNWFFFAAVGSGALAACVIISVLIAQAATPSASPHYNVADIRPNDTSVRMTALAGAGWRGGNDFNLNDDRRLP